MHHPAWLAFAIVIGAFLLARPVSHLSPRLAGVLLVAAGITALAVMTFTPSPHT